MGDNDEEGENFTWVNGKFRVFSGDGEIIDVLLQNRDDDGENTGEFETATEQDIFFWTLSSASTFFAFFVAVVFVFVFLLLWW